MPIDRAHSDSSLGEEFSCCRVIAVIAANAWRKVVLARQTCFTRLSGHVEGACSNPRGVGKVHGNQSWWRSIAKKLLAQFGATRNGMRGLLESKTRANQAPRLEEHHSAGAGALIWRVAKCAAVPKMEYVAPGSEQGDAVARLFRPAKQ